MRLRLELFVGDLDHSVDFYRRVLRFHLVRQDPGYASLSNGAVVLASARPPACRAPGGWRPGRPGARRCSLSSLSRSLSWSADQPARTKAASSLPSPMLTNLLTGRAERHRDEGVQAGTALRHPSC